MEDIDSEEDFGNLEKELELGHGNAELKVEEDVGVVDQGLCNVTGKVGIQSRSGACVWSHETHRVDAAFLRCGRRFS